MSEINNFVDYVCEQLRPVIITVNNITRGRWTPYYLYHKLNGIRLKRYLVHFEKCPHGVTVDLENRH